MVLLAVLGCCVVGAGQLAAQQPCIPSDTELCLNGGRFRVTVDWETPGGESGEGRVVPFGGTESGLFWFFRQNNWEMMVKVLNGCAVNGHFWVFSAATTNVGYTLHVTDTLTATDRSYTNPPGTPAPAVTDTAAFAGCGISEAVGVTPPAPERVGRLPARSAGTPAGSCVASTTGLCLNENRFRAEVAWTTKSGETGHGKVVPFGSSDSGLFWFFREDNWEMMVKVLDGCRVNGHYWVFSAATTDVEYTLSVTDSMTGRVERYSNPGGTAARPVTDTLAFDTCGASPPPTPRIEFRTDRSFALPGAGQEASLEVDVFAPDGAPLPDARVTWSSSDPSLVSVIGAGPREAIVRAETAAAGSAEITARYQGAEAVAVILVTLPGPATVVIPSALVVSRTDRSVRLRRTDRTAALREGDILVSGERAALLDRVSGVTVAADRVTVDVRPASLPEAFEELRFTGESASYRIEFEQSEDGTGRVSVRNERGEVVAVAEALQGFRCRDDSGGDVAVALRGADVQVSRDFVLEWMYEVHGGEVEHFLLAVRGTASATVTAGVLEFDARVAGRVTCSVEGATVTPVRVPVGLGLILAVGITPSVGVEAELAFAGPRFRLGGPTGVVSLDSRAGIEYVRGQGWRPVGSADWSGHVAQSPPALDRGEFSAETAAFAALDLGLRADWGVPPFGVSLADVRFAELREAQYVEFELPFPLDPADSRYSGPDWELGIEVTGSLGAELGGALGELLDVLGLGSALTVGPVQVFRGHVPLARAPRPRISADRNRVEVGETVTFAVTGGGTGAGGLELWTSRNGQRSLTELTGGRFRGPEERVGWTPMSTDRGTHAVHARLKVDAISGIKPYASIDRAVVQVGTDCTFSLDPTRAAFAPSGGSGTVSIAASDAGCVWAAVSHDPWITLAGRASGAGDGSVDYQVEPNPLSQPRSGSIGIAGMSVEVTQDGVGCAYSIDPASAAFDAAGGAGAISVFAAAADCSWTAGSHAPWITITASPGGAGDGTVHYAVESSTSSAPRTGTISVADETFTVTQDAYTPSCVVTTGVEYILSGGTSQSAGIYVDDILRVYLNGAKIAEFSQSGRCCPPAPPVRFTASTGDVLRIQAQDANQCYSLEALYLQKADGSCLRQLTDDISGPNCGSEPPEQIFFDSTYVLP